MFMSLPYRHRLGYMATHLSACCEPRSHGPQIYLLRHTRISSHTQTKSETRQYFITKEFSSKNVNNKWQENTNLLKAGPPHWPRDRTHCLRSPQGIGTAITSSMAHRTEPGDARVGHCCHDTEGPVTSTLWAQEAEGFLGTNQVTDRAEPPQDSPLIKPTTYVASSLLEYPVHRTAYTDGSMVYWAPSTHCNYRYFVRNTPFSAFSFERKDHSSPCGLNSPTLNKSQRFCLNAALVSRSWGNSKEEVARLT